MTTLPTIDPPNPQVTSARPGFRDGISWVTASWDLFTAKAGFWILFGLCSIVLTALASVIPVAGSIIGFMIAPIFSASYVLSATLQEHGRELKIEHLFLGFRSRLDQLVLVGVFQLLLSIGALVAAVAITGVFLGGTLILQHSDFSSLLQSMMRDLNAQLSAADSGVAAPSYEVGPIFIFAAFVAASFWVILAFFVTMMGWFAPALVVLREMDAWPAMRASLRAGMTRVMPLLGYSVGLIGVFLMVLFTLGAGLIVAIPWVQLSTYTAFKSLFPAPPAPPAAAVTPGP